MTLREKQLDIPLPNRIVEKSSGLRMHKLHTFKHIYPDKFIENNCCVFNEFAVKWCTKCASSTIQKIHWNLMRKPENFPVDDWQESFAYPHIKLKGRIQYTDDKPLYAFYRDPIERFISSCNFLLWETDTHNPDWVGPSSITEMIEFVQYYNLLHCMDIFWPQSIFLIKPDLYEAVYKTSYLNEFFKSWGIDVDQYGSEKIGQVKGPFSVNQLSQRDISIVKDLYHMDYLLGWGE